MMNAGDIFVVAYPFLRCKVEIFDGEGLREIDSWRPGVEDHGELGEFADAVGQMSLTVVSTHKPGKYPERVFYTRRFTTPDGVAFGKGHLRITTAQAFRRLCQGFRHPYCVEDSRDGEP